jgi:hypothetical protein
LKREDNAKQNNAIKSKNNNLFENGRQPNFSFLNEVDLIFFGKLKTTSKTIMQLKTTKSKTIIVAPLRVII